jgi:hypothetical protein
MNPMDREVARISKKNDDTDEGTSPTFAGADIFEQPIDFKHWSRKK